MPTVQAKFLMLQLLNVRPSSYYTGTEIWCTNWGAKFFTLIGSILTKVTRNYVSNIQYLEVWFLTFLEEYLKKIS